MASPGSLLAAARFAIVPLLLLLAGGCAMPGTAERPATPNAARAAEAEAAQAAADAESARTAALQAQSAGEPQYLRFKAEQTQLAAVQDDGSLTYLEFASRPDPETEFFDQDGRLLRVAVAGRVVAIAGLHAGILVRRADRASFVSPNPRALSLPRRALPGSADYGEARAMLESQASQQQAMQRAIEAARGGSGSPARPVSPTQPSLSLSRFVPPVALAPSAAAPLLAPLAAANASASAAERGLVRVFFATASRAIVAPDDGLGLLLREAANADEIRVTGFTDATGSRATNDALALARADAVVRILLRRGIPADRIFSGAAGAAGFIADNASEKGRALNRRVEVLMLRNGVPLAFGGMARAMR